MLFKCNILHLNVYVFSLNSDSNLSISIPLLSPSPLDVKQRSINQTIIQIKYPILRYMNTPYRYLSAITGYHTGSRKILTS